MRLNNKLKLGLVVISGLLLMFSVMGMLPIAGVARSTTRPFGGGLLRFGGILGNRLDELRNLGNLRQQNQQLRDENHQLSAQNSELARLRSENQQLRDQLKFPKTASYSLLGADVIGFQPDSLRQFVRINRGQADGVSVGMAVVSGNALVGKITRVQANSADVLIMQDGEFRALAIDQSSQATGLVKGQAGTNLSMERIPQNQSVKIGDPIVTSGLDGDFPPGLLIGKVAAVDQPAESIFQSAQVEPSLDSKRLRVVSVVIKQVP